MGRWLLIALGCVALGACGDPLIILGDLPGYMRIVAGVPDVLGTTNDTLATVTRLRNPRGIAVSSDGTLYIADESARIMSVTSSGRLTVLYNTNGCTLGCLRRPRAMALTNDNTALIIADDLADRVWRFTISNRQLQPIATVTGVAGVAVLADNRIVVSEPNAGALRFVDGAISTFVTGLDAPYGLTVSGNQVYVTEVNSNTIRSVDVSTKAVRLIAGNGTTGFTGDGGPAISASFAFPSALAVSGNNLYVADEANYRVRLINLRTGMVTTFAGTGARAYNGNGRAAAETALGQPSALALSPFGFLYISATANHVVWRTAVTANVQ
jgi:trimeric autotransporter adhesin